MFCVQIWLCKKHTPIQLNGRSLSPVKLISYIVALPDSFDKMMMMSVLCNGKKSNSKFVAQLGYIIHWSQLVFALTSWSWLCATADNLPVVFFNLWSDPTVDWTGVRDEYTNHYSRDYLRRPKEDDRRHAMTKALTYIPVEILRSKHINIITKLLV